MTSWRDIIRKAWSALAWKSIYSLIGIYTSSGRNAKSLCGTIPTSYYWYDRVDYLFVPIPTTPTFRYKCGKFVISLRVPGYWPKLKTRVSNRHQWQSQSRTRIILKERSIYEKCCTNGIMFFLSKSFGCVLCVSGESYAKTCKTENFSKKLPDTTLLLMGICIETEINSAEAASSSWIFCRD